MRKHWAFFRQGLLIAFQFRAEVILWVILDILPFLVLAFVWQAIFISQGTDQLPGGQTLGYILQYYLLVALINRLSEDHFEEERSEEIRMGKIDLLLVKPYHYVYQVFTSSLSDKFLSLLWVLPSLVVFGWILFQIDATTIDFVFHWSQLATFLILLIFAYCIHFLISLCTVFLTFWFEGSSGLEHFKWASVAILSGSIMPIDLMPVWLADIIQTLPFQYLYAVPIMVLQGNYQVTVGDWGMLALTILGLAGVATLLWQWGQRTYSSAGG